MESEQNVTSHPLWIHISWNFKAGSYGYGSTSSACPIDISP